MRFPRALISLSTTLTVGIVPAALAAQGPVKVEVSMPASHTVWYTDPMWLGVGAAAVFIIIILAVMASRSGEKKSTTTVIR
jgi:hypothetical protein